MTITEALKLLKKDGNVSEQPFKQPDTDNFHISDPTNTSHDVFSGGVCGACGACGACGGR